MFQKESQACQFYCKDLGPNPDPFNENGYYNCTKFGNVVAQIQLTCPVDHFFNKNTLECTKYYQEDQPGNN